MKKLIFSGAAVALITPFHEDGSINFEKYGELIDWQIAKGTDAIVAVATTGENATLSGDEHRKLMEFAVKRVNKRVPIICSTGSNDTAYGKNTTKAAEEAGADGLLLVTPYYNKTSQHGLIKHYEKLLEDVSLPAIVYNVPSRTGFSIAAETYKELSKHPQIVATKEASGNLSLVAKVLDMCGDDLAVYSGNDDQIVPIMSLGGKGVISVLSNILPFETHEICRLCLEDNFTEARRLALKYLDVANKLFIDVNPVPVKEAMNLMGMGVGPCRLPLYEMREQDKIALRTSLERVGLVK